MAFKFELKEGVRDALTGFAGGVSQRADCVGGCNRYEVAPSVSSSGEAREPCWFDEGRLRVWEAPGDGIDGNGVLRTPGDD